MSSPSDRERDLTEDLPTAYRRVRHQTEALAARLGPEDQTAQAVAEASPTKWHRGHVTWFFETLVLKPHLSGYQTPDPLYEYLFNSYYNLVGPQYPRPRRGVITRPGVAAVAAYRAHVDAAMAELLADPGEREAVAPLVTLGLHHEQQHQELLLMDILTVFAENPLDPAYAPETAPAPGPTPAPPAGWETFEGGVTAIGHEGPGFAYDNEGPRHEVLLRPYRLADRLVTNGEWLAFMADGGYQRPALWLSDGWEAVQERGWQAPGYWRPDGAGGWTQLTLSGRHPVDAAAPVCHVSYYEADAYARWAGHRLPSEAEWEAAAGTVDAAAAGTLLTDPASGLHPRPAPAGPGLRQMVGEVWEWTASPYGPYPGFRPAAGAVGEYNGKFMCNQMVLRGGSLATPADHLRLTYRNFFYPHERWAFAGLRLAADG